MLTRAAGKGNVQHRLPWVLHANRWREMRTRRRKGRAKREREGVSTSCHRTNATTKEMGRWGDGRRGYERALVVARDRHVPCDARDV